MTIRANEDEVDEDKEEVQVKRADLDGEWPQCQSHLSHSTSLCLCFLMCKIKRVGYITGFQVGLSGGAKTKDPSACCGNGCCPGVCFDQRSPRLLKKASLCIMVLCGSSLVERVYR